MDERAKLFTRTVQTMQNRKYEFVKCQPLNLVVVTKGNEHISKPNYFVLVKFECVKNRYINMVSISSRTFSPLNVMKKSRMFLMENIIIHWHRLGIL